MNAPLRIGVIGANPDSGWAARAHLPAIAALPGVELTAVATTRMTSARAAAERYGARHAFDSPEALVSCPDVDAVVVAVRVPGHRALVDAAVAAGRHVYCEWPLGVALADAEGMADRARAAGVRTAIGLQARSAPEVNLVRDLVRQGRIGTPLTASATALSSRGAEPVAAAKRYLFDARTGANLFTIEFAHLLDAVGYVIGTPTELAGHTRVRRPDLVDDEGGTILNDTPDVVVAVGATADDALLSLHVAQGTHADETTRITIVGSTGALRLTTRGPGGVQMAPAALEAAFSSADAFTPLEVPADYRTVEGVAVSTAVNVAEALSAFARDIATGSTEVPDFDSAVDLHRTLALLDDTARRTAVEV